MTTKNRGTKSNLVSLYLKNNYLGKVQSIFKNGLNVQFDNYLIYISNTTSSLAAFGINIQDDEFKHLLEYVRIGDVVVNKGGKLIFYSPYEIITIDYKRLKEIDMRIPHINCSRNSIFSTKLYKTLEKIPFQELVGIELDDISCYYIKLIQNNDMLNENTYSEIIKFFAGRGKGLTPSGDDILIGYTLALMIFNESKDLMRQVQLGITEKTTTLISVAYLRALLDGYISEYYLLLVRTLDDDTHVDEVIKKVQSVGHTSGNDTLFGFYLGLKLMTK